MNHLTVDPATLTSVAATYSTVADDVGAVASRIDADGVALSAVFGVIGADFVAATQSSTHRHRRRIGALADEARRIAGGLGGAAADYRATDVAAGAALASTAGTVLPQQVA